MAREAFIQVIQAITGPVIFVTVVIGIASIGSLAKAGGLAVKALTYFFVMTVVALVLGLLGGNIIAPGSGIDGQHDAAARADAKAEIGEQGSSRSSPTTSSRTRSSRRSWRTRSCASSCTTS